MPVIDCGRYPAKSVVGEQLTVAATVYREGHDAVGVNVVLRDSTGRTGPWTPMRLVAPGTDRYEAVVTADTTGPWTFQIEAWGDPLESWRHDARIKVPEGQDVELMLEEGARLHEQAAANLANTTASGSEGNGDTGDAGRLLSVADTLRSPGDPVERLSAALARGVLALLARHPLRTLLTASPSYPLWVDRERALFGSWYEFFPRSEGATLDPPKSGTFATAAKRLPAIAAMGFDVVYLPPVHPIGTTFRKGPNNTLTPGPGDPGVPWAIGSSEGGHDAIHPDLGTMDDFDAFVATARANDLEIALDLALQCSPDHPWVTATPGVVHDPCRRHHRLRREPAEEVPGHLPAELRQRLRGPLRRGPADRAVLDEPRREDLPGRQPAHQAGAVLGALLADIQLHRPGRAVPGRGVHPAGDDARPGQGRLPPVLHLLHLAQHEARARAIPHRAGRTRPRMPAPELLRQHPGHPARVPAVRRPARFQDPGRAGRDDGCRPGVSTQATSCSSTSRCARAARSTSTPRSTSTGRATTRPPRPPAGAWPATSRRSTGSAASTRPCNGCATCSSTQPTTPRSSPTPSRSSPMTRPTRSSSSSTSTRSTSARRPSRSTCRHSGFDWGAQLDVTDLLSGARYTLGQHNYVRLDPHVEPAHIFLVSNPQSHP